MSVMTGKRGINKTKIYENRQEAKSIEKGGYLKQW